MLFKELAELDDCEQCPLYKEEICPGGMTSSPGGIPIEPPCCGFDDDTDLDAWVSDYFERQRRHEAYLDEQYKKQQEKKRKADLKKRRQQFLKFYCYSEAYDVKKLKKQIKAIENAISFAESMAFAFNMANEMFQYEERTQVNPKANEQLEKLKEQLKEAEEKLKTKREEGRNTEKYKAIQ